MQVFRAKDVERVLGMRRSALRMLVQDGLVTPERGPGRQYRFSFRDLARLRSAQALLQANVSPRRVALTLPVRDERGLLTTPAGQYLLDLCFSPSPTLESLNDTSVLQILESPSDEGYAVEEHEPDDIARLEWGRQLREEGLMDAAEAIYRGGLHEGNGPPALLIALGELLEQTDRELEAIDCYQRALGLQIDDPERL